MLGACCNWGSNAPVLLRMGLMPRIGVTVGVPCARPGLEPGVRRVRH